MWLITVQQTSLAKRVEYADGVNEFIKSGFTQVPSDLVKPFRVQESPVQFECKVTQIIALGEKVELVILCEVVKIHINASFRRKRSNRSI
jgi:flavin reductase (DIM6/NTAB) family NADH-FMN oxidoreductase RutF